MNMASSPERYDTVIVGGSNAGLSAALMLGRGRRRVLVCDTGKPANAPAHEAHGFFTRDGTPPSELLRIGREQLQPYMSVELRHVAITGATSDDTGFAVALSDGTTVQTRSLLLATGVQPVFPAIEGVAERWGEGVNQCPYCHGWEVRDQPLAVYAAGDHGFHYALMIANWSRDIIALTDGPAAFSDAQWDTLKAREIRVQEGRIARLEGPGRTLAAIIFADGTRLPRHGLFMAPGKRQHSDLAAQLGCALTPDGSVQVNPFGLTSVPGVYAAGDMTHIMMQSLPVAVAEGATAGAMLNNALIMAGVAH